MADREFKIRIVGDASGVAPATQQTTAELNKVGAAGQEAHKRIHPEVEKTVSHHTLAAQAVKGLRSEFPELYHVAHMALHPITLSVAEITGAFALWEKRMQELENLLGGLKLPDISEKEIGHVSAAAEAWSKYAEGARKAKTEAEGLAAAQERSLRAIKAELELHKQLAAAQKAEGEARLEADRPKLGERKYQRTKLDFEHNVEEEVNKREEAAAKAEHTVKARGELEHRRAGLRDELQAGSIHVAGADDDAKTLADMKAQAEEAKKNKKERQERIGDLLDYKSGEESWATSMKVKARQIYTGMSVDEMLEMERQGLETDQAPIDRYERRLKGQKGRDTMRGRRDALYGEAGKEMSAADKLGRELPEEAEANRKMIGRHREEERLHDETRTLAAQTANREASEALKKEMDAAYAAGNAVMFSAVRKLQELKAIADDLSKRLAAIETQGKYGTRPSQ